MKILPEYMTRGMPFVLLGVDHKIENNKVFIKPNNSWILSSKKVSDLYHYYKVEKGLLW